MKVDYKKFDGTLPYASEIFGTYQPLLGWKSKRTFDRFSLGLQRARMEAIESILPRFYADAKFQITDFTHDNVFFEISALGPGTLQSPTGTGVPPAYRTYVTELVADAIATKSLNPEDEKIWDKLVSKDALNKILQRVRQLLQDNSAQVVREGLPSVMDPATFNFGQNAHVVTEIVTRRISRESGVAGALNYLYENQKFDTLKQFFFPKSKAVDLSTVEEMQTYIDPMESFNPRADIGRVSLSPIGLVHLFRQYFFEFETFLGSPVQHIWLSPGSSLELVEIHTRKQLQERLIESSLEMVVKSEKSSTEQDELSDAVRDENQNNTKFGVSINAGGSVSGGVQGVYSATGHIDTTTNYNLDNNQKTARESAHKQMRQQSEKLSSEIKKNFKTAFKTITETQDVTSRRYVLQNSSPQLVNYELRRKMRQVGVQVQDIGTQLCWQTYLDLPGSDLGIASLVHIAEPPDLAAIPPPEAPVIPQPITKDHTVRLFFQGWVGDNDTNNTYVEHGAESDDGWAVSDGAGNDKIHMNYPAYTVEAVPGFELTQVVYDSCIEGKMVEPEFVGLTPTTFGIHLKRVNFDGDAITLNLKLVYSPSDDTISEAKKKFETDMANYDAEKARLQKEAFVKSARDRIKLASNVEPRRFDELREEERTVVYRHLIGSLLNVGVPLDNARTRHVLAELIESMFDVDKMLYFVAPEWWLPRQHQTTFQNVGGEPGNLFKTEDIVSWGGAQSNYRANYYITEDSTPARLGSSLGWLLQLDGDNLRNAFLNAPWVKAVIPIRPGKEMAALNWLMHAHVEGTDGIDARYQAASDSEINEMIVLLDGYPWPDGEEKSRYTNFAAKIDADPEKVFVSIRDALVYLSLKVKQKFEASNQTVDETVDGRATSYLPTEKVFEKGFDPLIGGFKAAGKNSFEVFDTWVEVLPTDQIVAVPVEYDPKTGMQK
ncbi:conserved hypothetical protein [Paraburkholderia sabiae]|uniref:hypothetical protein n=1 Tax=Paraburkholderia sabiae TaxID=273251 RepID=UPI001CAB9B64|nr:hypothetical protein [Paraburkholderia sabiae]CAG9226243.1 conserved hypothetical protein [Paraburkholderia sabiae]